MEEKIQQQSCSSSSNNKFSFCRRSFTQFGITFPRQQSTGSNPPHLSPPPLSLSVLLLCCLKQVQLWCCGGSLQYPSFANLEVEQRQSSSPHPEHVGTVLGVIPQIYTVIPASLLAAVRHECDCHSSLNSLKCPGHPGGFILVGFHFIRTSTKVLSVGDNEFQAFPRFWYNFVVYRIPATLSQLQ